MYKHFFKRVFDFIIALVALILLSPIFLIVMIGLYFANQGKPFFFQARPGLNEKIFKIIKFKTMNDKKDANGNLLSDAERLTPIGAFVRKTSLDELPQLINVLQGNMSLVGPRPLLTDYAHLYSEYQNQRHQVLPGITGYVQVKGRNALTWEERFDLDVYYVQHISFIFDCKILFLTFITLFDFKKSRPQKGISIEPFEGQW